MSNGPGRMVTGTRTKLQAPSLRTSTPRTRTGSLKLQASSRKAQAPSFKLHAASSNNFCISIQLIGGHGPWPLSNSSWIMDPGTSFKALGPRALIRMNVFFGCDLWNEIWCGENFTLFPLVTFSSIVKKCPEVLYPNTSGIPSKLRFSIRLRKMEHVFFLRSWYNFLSGAITFSRLLGYVVGPN